ncbi:MAG TPA: AAA family ATPase, partial [bacterium]|nr:AAA family ATPase [bacterium]
TEPGQVDHVGQPEQARIFKWMSELRRQPDGTKWLWEGFLSRGGVTLFSALWKIGKTTLLGYLVRSFDGRSTEFLGQKVTPSKVLYVTEEHEELWAERRDELGIADHVGMVCRPFRGKPSPAEWVQFIGKLVEAVAEHQFDLVILDTISKLWPVREENDASQVEEALMPLWSITNTGAALFLVHHTRKAGGGEFTGSRGSGGLPAFCETLIEFRRAEDNTKDPKRVLNAKGRYKDTPDKLLIELTPAGYVSHGDPDDPTVRATFGENLWKQRGAEIIPTAPPGITLDDFIHNLGDNGARREVIIEWLAQRVEDGEFIQTGKGTKGSPKRWHKVG